MDLIIWYIGTFFKIVDFDRIKNSNPGTHNNNNACF